MTKVYKTELSTDECEKRLRGKIHRYRFRLISSMINNFKYDHIVGRVNGSEFEYFSQAPITFNRWIVKGKVYAENNETLVEVKFISFLFISLPSILATLFVFFSTIILIDGLLNDFKDVFINSCIFIIIMAIIALISACTQVMPISDIGKKKLLTFLVNTLHLTD